MAQVTQYRRRVGSYAEIEVRHTTVRGLLVGYAVVLLAIWGDRPAVVRVFDNAHGENEMHRYTREGKKLTARRFHDGSASEAMNAAIDWVDERGDEVVHEWLS